MNRLIVTCGISNSGKSTYAAKMVQENPYDYVRVNRDKLREMLYGYTEEDVKDYYHRDDLYKLEEQVTQVENNLIEHFLNQGKNVVVDATHLKPKYLNRFDIFSMNEIEIVFCNVTLKEALTRNMSRNRQVDENIIITQHNNYVNLTEFLDDNSLKFQYIRTEIN